MDSQQVFLVPQVPPLPNTNLPSTIHHQPQKCTTQMVQQQRQLHHMQPQCNICGTTQKLLRCAKCKTIYYCSTDHQHVDWPTHKQECKQMAKKRQNNNRLTQLTNGCGAININSQSICNISCSSSSATLPTNNWSSSIAHQEHQQHQQQQPLQNSNSLNVEDSFTMGSHEKEILNSKAESVTQTTKRSNFDANSTTTDQMHIMAQNDTLDLYDMIESSQEFMDNAYYYETTQLPEEESELKLQQPSSNATLSLYEDSLTRPPLQQQPENELVLTEQCIANPSEANSSSQQQQHFIQQPHDYVPQQQQLLQYPIPQLSNHLINQHEKSSSYQIGTPVFDESIFENAK